MFVKARGQSPELFEMGEGTFDAIALALDFAHRARRDDGEDAALAEMAQDRIGVIALVGEAQFPDGDLRAARWLACSRWSGRPSGGSRAADQAHYTSQ